MNIRYFRGEKKSIIGKYTLQSQVTCLKWVPNGIVFGSADGKVKSKKILCEKKILKSF